MADIVLTGNTSGAITVAAPAVAGTNTLTLPANTGTLMTSTYTSGDVDIDSGTLHVDATNNRVGIGTSSPSYKLQVAGGAADNNNAANVIVIDGENHSRLKVNTSTSGGYQASLVLSSGEALSSTTNEVKISTTGSQEMRFTTASSERMRITQDGRINFTVTGNGATSSNQGISIGGGSNSESFIEIVRGSGTSEYTHMYFGNGNGTVGTIRTSGTSTSYNTSSDYRLKENVEPMTGSIDRLKELKPSRFNFINDPDTAVDGFLAHEAQEVVPEAVVGTKNAMCTEEYEVTPAVLDDNSNTITAAVMGTREVPDYQGIDQSKLVPLLTSALQEAITKIEDLETRIQALENA